MRVIVLTNLYPSICSIYRRAMLHISSYLREDTGRVIQASYWCDLEEVSPINCNQVKQNLQIFTL